jgi:hypothetical protein
VTAASVLVEVVDLSEPAKRLVQGGAAYDVVRELERARPSPPGGSTSAARPADRAGPPAAVEAAGGPTRDQDAVQVRVGVPAVPEATKPNVVLAPAPTAPL